jgi:VanZ family protein
MLVHRRVWLAASLCLVGVVVYLSLVPHPPQPLAFDDADKLEHCLAYATLALCFCQLYPRGTACLAIIASLALLGITLEFIQGRTGYRTFDVNDMAANGVGVLFGYALSRSPLGRAFIFIEAVMQKSYGR